MKLLLVRHGQTDWNLTRRYQGHTDIPLNALGIRQAAALKRRLAHEPITCIHASDLSRAHATAQIISGGSLKIHPDARLREMYFGSWEGLTYPEVQSRYPAALAAFEADPIHFPPPNGETLAALASRASAFLDDLRANPDGSAILLVAHGGLIQVLICLALQLPLSMYWQFQVAPASLSELLFYPAGAILSSLNHLNHLKRLPRLPAGTFNAHKQ